MNDWGYKMHLQESGEMYLESILILTNKNGSVRSLDVAEYMGFSKPSVSRAVSLLKNGGYIIVNGDGHLILTDVGREVAEKIYDRHDQLTKFLISLGVNPNTASEDACRMEHNISDETLEAIKRFNNK